MACHVDSAAKLLREVEDVSLLSISAWFAVNGESLADVTLRSDTTVRKLGNTIAVAALRSRKAAFAVAPRLVVRASGKELDHELTLAEAGLAEEGAGPQHLVTDAYPTVVTASADGTARIWNVEKGECEKVLEGHRGPLHSAGFSPDAKLVATASEDCTAKLWASVTGDCWRTLRGHRDAVNVAAFSPDGKLLVTASNDSTGKVWSTKSGECLLTLEGHEKPVFEASFTADGEHVITNSQDGKSKIWDTKEGTLLRTVHGSSVTKYQTSFSPDGRFFVTAPGNATAQVCEMECATCEVLLRGHSGVVVSAVYAPAACPLILPSGSRSPRSPRSPRSQLNSTSSTSLGKNLSALDFAAEASPAPGR